MMMLQPRARVLLLSLFFAGVTIISFIHLVSQLESSVWATAALPSVVVGGVRGGGQQNEGAAYDDVSPPTTPSTFIYKHHSDPLLEPNDCSELLQQHRSGDIEQTKESTENYPIGKSYVVRTDTEYPFHASVHDGKVDTIRVDVFKYGQYYERVMSGIVAELYNEALQVKKQQQPIMLDVGANIGWFSLLAASHGAEVFAFEPNVINMVRFCESQKLNDWSGTRIHSYLKGIGNKHGEQLKMYKVDANNPGSFTFSQEAKFEEVEGGVLPLVTLDALAKDQGWLEDDSDIEIALMKIDVERVEHLALQGAQQLLKSNIIQNILMELKSDTPPSDLEAIATSLISSGYELYKVGSWSGPDKEVETTYTDPKVLAGDISSKKFGSNAWFRIREQQDK